MRTNTPKQNKIPRDLVWKITTAVLSKISSIWLGNSVSPKHQPKQDQETCKSTTGKTKQQTKYPWVWLVTSKTKFFLLAFHGKKTRKFKFDLNTGKNVWMLISFFMRSLYPACNGLRQSIFPKFLSKPACGTKFLRKVSRDPKFLNVGPGQLSTRVESFSLHLRLPDSQSRSERLTRVF